MGEKWHGQKDAFRAEAKTVYERIDRLSRGTLTLVVATIRSFLNARATEAAASIAYYTLFSFFPLLIILVTVGSSILEGEEAQEQLLYFIREFLPLGHELIEENVQRFTTIAETMPSLQDLAGENLQRLLELRRPVGIFATIGLLWAATSVFVALAHNVDRAWNGTERRNFLKGRLIGLAMVAILAVLLILALIATAILGVLAQLEIPLPLMGNVPFYETFLWAALSRLVPWVLTFMMALGLYRWAPKTEVRWSEAGWGALVATLGWELSKEAFGWYLGSGLARQQLIYGSLGTVVALMLWVYLSGLIFLFGAHLSAAIGHRRKRRERGWYWAGLGD